VAEQPERPVDHVPGARGDLRAAVTSSARTHRLRQAWHQVPRRGVHDELAELERIAGALLRGNRYAIAPPPSLDRSAGLFCPACWLGSRPTGAGASATVWVVLALSRLGVQAPRMLHKQRCMNMNTAVSPAGRWPYRRVAFRNMMRVGFWRHAERLRNLFRQIQTDPLPAILGGSAWQPRVQLPEHPSLTP
jgi:hypothetical protein